MDRLEERNAYFRKMLLIGLPIVGQNLISIGVNLLDTVMIGRLGEDHVAAVGAANQVFFVYSLFLFGLYSGASVFASQYFGAGDLKGVRRVLGIDAVIGFSLGALVTVAAEIFAPGLVRLFSRDPAVVELGAYYMRIVALSYALTALSFVISFNSRAIQRLRAVTLINAGALSVNLVLNYVLIFGKAGFPALGVNGAAIATCVARICELTMLLLYVKKAKDHPFSASLAELLGFDRDLFKRVLRIALPVAFTEWIWSLVTAVIFAAYGLLGTAALAVTQVTNVVTELLQSAFFGVGNATAMIIGEKLGQKRSDVAFYYAKLALFTVMVLNVAATLILLLIARPIAGVYGFGAESMELLVRTIKVQAYLITPKMFAYIFIIGILRAGGDAVFCMFVDMICNIVIMMGGTFVCILVFHLDLPSTMGLVSLADAGVKIALCIPRFRSGKWMNYVT
ncbi:MAG: MATE family efflux transporter [Firmicutes bacterium]|nr:MATE family efflux transporter [Bacillota bacterium]